MPSYGKYELLVFLSSCVRVKVRSVVQSRVLGSWVDDPNGCLVAPDSLFCMNKSDLPNSIYGRVLYLPLCTLDTFARNQCVVHAWVHFWGVCCVGSWVSFEMLLCYFNCFILDVQFETKQCDDSNFILLPTIALTIVFPSHWFHMELERIVFYISMNIFFISIHL